MGGEKKEKIKVFVERLPAGGEGGGLEKKYRKDKNIRRD
jgi:hypothetical protein